MSVSIKDYIRLILEASHSSKKGSKSNKVQLIDFKDDENFEYNLEDRDVRLLHAINLASIADGEGQGRIADEHDVAELLGQRNLGAQLVQCRNMSSGKNAYISIEQVDGLYKFHLLKRGISALEERGLWAKSTFKM